MAGGQDVLVRLHGGSPELSLDSPLLAQISRWDVLKDPLGVLAAFAEHVHAEEEPHLLLSGPGRPRRRG